MYKLLRFFLTKERPQFHFPSDGVFTREMGLKANEVRKAGGSFWRDGECILPDIDSYASM